MGLIVQKSASYFFLIGFFLLFLHKIQRKCIYALFAFLNLIFNNTSYKQTTMASTPEFKYQHPFPLGEDKTEYYLLTKDYVSVSEFEGTPVLKVAKEGLTMMANQAFRDVSFLLRRSHNECVAKILTDPEASDNDKYVALNFLRNAEIAAKGKLPLCQDGKGRRGNAVFEIESKRCACAPFLVGAHQGL